MRTYNNAFISLIYYIKEVMQNNGFNSDNVIDSYLNQVDFNRVDVLPTISVTRGRCFGRNVEIGSIQQKSAYFAVDIFASSKSQRDDLADLLFDSLNEVNIPMYDFNTGFPVSVGDYTGIIRIGEIYINNISMFPLEPPERTTIKGEENHAVVDGIINFNV